MNKSEYYRVVDQETGKEIHDSFPREGALLWAARWCDDNGYGQINVDDENNTIIVSYGEYVSRR